MDDKRIEELFRKNAMEEMPDLWQRIEGELPPEDNNSSQNDEQDVSSPKRKAFSRSGWNRWGKWAAAAACLLLVAGPVRAGLVRIGAETKQTDSVQTADSWKKDSGFFSGDILSSNLSAASQDYESDVVEEYGSYSVQDSMYSEDVPLMAKEEMSESDSGSLSGSEGSENTLTGSDRKLIRTVSVTVETLDFDAFSTDLERAVTQAGGYFESRRVSGNSGQSDDGLMYGSYTIRIPESALEDFSEKMDGLGNILSRNENVEDVTLQYSDTEGRIRSLKKQQDRLLELLEDAENVEDIITIEARLSEVEYELESYQSSKNILDNQISYVTIQLEASEVQKVTPPAKLSIWERIRLGLGDSLDNLQEGCVDFLVGLIVCFPYLLAAAVMIGVIVIIVKKVRRKK